MLTVRDHGPGFEESDLPFVFDRFYRAQNARRLPGSGLGLAIVRQAAEASSGFAEAANAPGGGALLRVSFGPPLEFAGRGLSGVWPEAGARRAPFRLSGRAALQSAGHSSETSNTGVDSPQLLGGSWSP